MTPEPTRVLITCVQMQECIDEFRSEFDARGIQIEMPEVVQQPTEEELMAVIGGFDGMIAGDDPLSARVLACAERMRIISKWGVGIDGIDLAAADEHDIAVTNTPGVFGDDVADVAAGYLTMVARQLHRIDASVRAGGWLKHRGVSLSGNSLGIVGFGSIGQAVARRGLGFGMQVAAQDVSEAAQEAGTGLGVEVIELEELLPRSNFLVLCTPLTPQTRHLLDERTLALLPRGAFVVNVARGPLIDEQALAAALGSGQLAAAALDVFEDEPLAVDHPLREFEQCVLGSHNGSNTHEGVLRASARAVENLLDGLEGRS